MQEHFDLYRAPMDPEAALPESSTSKDSQVVNRAGYIREQHALLISGPHLQSIAPTVLVSRFFNQIHDGCGNQACTKPHCFTYKQRISQKPQRRPTCLSARFVAIALATAGPCSASYLCDALGDFKPTRTDPNTPEEDPYDSNSFAQSLMRTEQIRRLFDVDSIAAWKARENGCLHSSLPLVTCSLTERISYVPDHWSNFLDLRVTNTFQSLPGLLESFDDGIINQSFPYQYDVCRLRLALKWWSIRLGNDLPIYLRDQLDVLDDTLLKRGKFEEAIHFLMICIFFIGSVTIPGQKSSTEGEWATSSDFDRLLHNVALYKLVVSLLRFLSKEGSHDNVPGGRLWSKLWTAFITVLDKNEGSHLFSDESPSTSTHRYPHQRPPCAYIQISPDGKKTRRIKCSARNILVLGLSQVFRREWTQCRELCPSPLAGAALRHINVLCGIDSDAFAYFTRDYDLSNLHDPLPGQARFRQAVPSHSDQFLLEARLAAFTALPSLTGGFRATANGFLSRPSDCESLLNYPGLVPPSFQREAFRAICFKRMQLARSHPLGQEALINHLIPTNLRPYGLFDRLAGFPAPSGIHAALSMYLTITVSNDSILNDIFDGIWHLEGEELLRPIKIRMMNNGHYFGYDNGGVAQETFRRAVNQALDPRSGFMRVNEESQTAWFNPATCEPAHRHALLGLAVALAVHNGFSVSVKFPLVLYRYLTLCGPENPHLIDIQDGWPNLYRGLEQLLSFDGDVENVLHHSYVFSFETLEGQVLDVDMRKYGRASSWYVMTTPFAS